jgi:hypothetical protein
MGRRLSWSLLLSGSRAFGRGFAALLYAAAALVFSSPAQADESLQAYREQIAPLLQNYCYDCHSGGEKNGSVAFDSFASEAELLADTQLWDRALRQIRAGLMPPSEGMPLPEAEQQRLATWIKGSVFHIDPAQLDPGRVTVRRLNRTEYRNTVRDLLGVEYDTQGEFPPDDTGHGFDNLGEALNISPLLLEKYLEAARTIVGQAVPTAARVMQEREIEGRDFRLAGAESAETKTDYLPLSYYTPASAVAKVSLEDAGDYELHLRLTANDKFVDGESDMNKCRFTFKADGETLLERDFIWHGGREFKFQYPRAFTAGDHDLTVEVTPLTQEKQVRSLELRVQEVTLRGPTAEEHWDRPPRYERFFEHEPPVDHAERRAHATHLLRKFATQAFRRPVDDATVERLTDLAERMYDQPGQSFEWGVAQAMTAVLASPRFLFREEEVEPAKGGEHPLVDEYALASRLSYFLWSTMPDEELFRLAGERQLRAQLPQQIERMLADSRAQQFVNNFVGQWLQARDIDAININAAAVVSRDLPPDPEADRRRERFRELRRKSTEELTAEEKAEIEELRKRVFGGFGRFRQYELNFELRRAMRRETELAFNHVLRENRSVLELVDADYTFLNERLAKHYGIDGVEGSEHRRVDLPAGSVRGGILTQGTMLAITSNPDRTSPVKRGLFILDNLLGTPPDPPPPDIPSLEEAGRAITDHTPTLRETLARHREDALCSSCHNRMDPLGLALENFNALGMHRDHDRGQPIDSTGELITGESFSNVRELKRLLASERRQDFYRCLTEKLLTYALGRGLEHYDVGTVDSLVEQANQNEGRLKDLVTAVIESAPFQRRRATEPQLSAAN